MNYLKGILLIFIVFSINAVFNSCSTEKEELLKYDFVYTSAEINQENGEVTFKGKVLIDGTYKKVKSGFVWSKKDFFDENTTHKIEIDYTTEEFEITTKLDAPQNEKIYYRAFVKSNNWYHFGETKYFINKGLKMSISDVQPMKLHISDTLTIKGENFGTAIDDITIELSGIIVEIIELKNDIIKIKIPNSIKANKKYSLKVNRSGNIVEFEKQIETLNFSIVDLYTNTLGVGDSITIETEFLNENNVILTIGEISKNVSVADNKIKTTVPYPLISGEFSLSILSGVNEVTYDKIITILPFKINDYIEEVCLGDTITLKGEHLPTSTLSYDISYSKYGNYKVEVVYAYKDSLKIVIPTEYNAGDNFNLFIKFEGNDLTKKIISAPIILDSIYPKQYMQGDIITLYGKNLRSEYGHITSYNPYYSGFDVFYNDFISCHKDSIKFVMKKDLGDARIKYSLRCCDIKSFEILHKEMKIISEVPDPIKLTEPFVLKVENLVTNTNYLDHNILLGGVLLDYDLDVENEELVIYPNKANLEDGSYDLQIGSIVKKVNIISPWKRIEKTHDLIDQYRYNEGIVYNDIVYIYSGLWNYKGEMLQYNIADNTWIQLPELPEQHNAIPLSSILIKDDIYFMMYYRDTQKSNFYRYSISSNEWTKLNSNITLDGRKVYSSALNTTENNVLLYYSGKYLNEYSIESDTWNNILYDKPDVSGSRTICEKDGVIYFLESWRDIVYKFNISERTFETTNINIDYLSEQVFFEIDNVVYEVSSKSSTYYNGCNLSVKRDFVYPYFTPNLAIPYNNSIIIITRHLDVISLDKNII